MAQKKGKWTARDLTATALMAVLICVCTWIAIPGPVPFTLQTFAVFTAVELLGARRGFWAVASYLLMGAAGLPVFSGMAGGAGILLGQTGGYLWGFLASGLIYWVLERFGKLPAMICGLVACYICGTLWFLQYSGGGLAFVLLRCVVPYLIPDGIKIFLAWSLSRRLHRHL